MMALNKFLFSLLDIIKPFNALGILDYSWLLSDIFSLLVSIWLIQQVDQSSEIWKTQDIGI